VNINRLNELLANPVLATREDYQNLEHLANNYPYAQFLKILLAKIAQIIKDEDQVRMLHTAAIYSADRTVLKSLYIQDKYQYVFPLNDLVIHERTEIFPEIPENYDLETDEKPEIHAKDNAVEPDTKIETLALDVLKNIKKYNDLREKYNHLLYDESDSTNVEEKDETLESSEVEPSQHKKPTPEIPPNNKDSEHIYQPDYQRQLIDDFMSNLDTQRERPLPSEKDDQSNEDLSGRSTSFDDGLVTETLAKLYIKQSKIDKAIDIYRKLIWKFPQKKAYFAARIEELTKI